MLPPGLWVRTPTWELALLRISVAQFYAEKVTFAGLGLVIPPGLTLLFRSLGLGIPLQIPALASIGLAAVMLFMPNYNALGSLLGASSRVSCSHAPDRGHRLHRTALARSCIGHGQPSQPDDFHAAIIATADRPAPDLDRLAEVLEAIPVRASDRRPRPLRLHVAAPGGHQAGGWLLGQALPEAANMGPRRQGGPVRPGGVDGRAALPGGHDPEEEAVANVLVQLSSASSPHPG